MRLPQCDPGRKRWIIVQVEKLGLVADVGDSLGWGYSLTIATKLSPSA